MATIDDAYMAVADLPDVRTDHVEAAAEMALEIRYGVPHLRWPSGAPMSVRIGIASTRWSPASSVTPSSQAERLGADAVIGVDIDYECGDTTVAWSKPRKRQRLER